MGCFWDLKKKRKKIKIKENFNCAYLATSVFLNEMKWKILLKKISSLFPFKYIYIYKKKKKPNNPELAILTKYKYMQIDYNIPILGSHCGREQNYALIFTTSVA